MAPKVRHEFFLHAPNAKAVYLSGSFNHWEPARTLLHTDRHGHWKIEMTLPPGRHEYRFVVDGAWISDPRARESVVNEFGETNSVVTIAQPPDVIISAARRDESGFWDRPRTRTPLGRLYRKIVSRIKNPRTQHSRRSDQK